MKDIDNLNILLYKISLYFDCMLSDEEEEALRRELSLTTLKHPEIDEAKALIGFRTIKSRSRPAMIRMSPLKKAVNFFNSPVRAAAAIILLAASSLLIPDWKHTEPGNKCQEECFAYVNGKLITDEEEVLGILAQDFNELDNGISEMQLETFEDLDSFGAILHDFESGEAPWDI